MRIIQATVICVCFASLLSSSNADVEAFCEDYNVANPISSLSSLSNNSAVQSSVETLNAGVDVANAEADKLVAKLQSYRGENQLLVFIESGMENENEFLKEYGIAMVPFAAPGIALCIFSLLCCPCCFFCSNRCCCRNRKNADEYSLFKKLLPIFFYMLFCVIACALAFVAISNIGQLVDGSVGTVCEFNQLSAEVYNFFDDVMTPVNQIANLSATILPLVASKVEDTVSIDTAYSALKGTLNNFTDVLNAIVLPDNFNSSTIVSDIVIQIVGAKNQLVDMADPIISSLDDTRESIQTSFVESQETIEEVVASAQDAIEGVLSFTDQLDGFVNQTVDYTDRYLSKTTMASYIFFTSVFLSLVAGIFVIITYATPCKMDDRVGRGCLSCSFILSYLFMMLLFLLSGVFLPISIVFSDACVVMDTIPSNFSLYLDAVLSDSESDYYGSSLDYNSSSSGGLGDLDVTTILSECFEASPPGILTLLGMSDQLDFTSAFDALQGDNLIDTESLDFTEISDLGLEVDALDRSSFGLTPQDISDVLAHLNDYARPYWSGTGSFQNYTLDDCTPTDTCDRTCTASSTCAPESDFSGEDTSTLDDLRDAVMDVAVAATQLDTIIEDIQDSMEAVTNSTANFTNEIIALNATFAEIQVDVQPLFDEVEILKTAGNCSFIPDVYYGIYDELCEATLQPAIVLALILFFIAICGIPMIITSLYIHTRLYGSKKDATVWADEA